MTGRIGTEFGVRAPIRVGQVRRQRIACTGADDFGDRGAQAKAPSCSAAAAIATLRLQYLLGARRHA